jgi:hypothetical protein
MTTSGDIIYGGTSGTGTRLAKGTDGQVLTLASGLPSWASPSGITALAAIGSTANANGASISGTTLTLQPANATYGGVVTTAAQTFAGAKTFSSDAIVNGMTVGKGTFSVTSNTSIGNAALNSITSSTGGSSTAIGYQALKAATTGGQNSAVGYQALNKNTTGVGSTAFGAGALVNATDGNYNIAIGNMAMNGGTLASGYGGDNVAVGTSSLSLITSGNSNIALGTFSGGNITTGSKNIFIGDNAGYKAGAGNGGSNSTGNNSVIIGWNARPSANGNSNEVVLAGYSSVSGEIIGLGTNTTLIGNSSTTNTKIWGALNIPNTTASTSGTTGSLTVGGGAGIAGALNVGTTATITGITTINSTASSTSTSTGALKVAGGAGIAGALNVGGNTVFTGTIEIEGGTPGAGKVLVSDANGLASWSANSNGGVSSITASATMAATDNYNFIVFSGSTASQTITLPSASLAGAGREITIKNIASVSVAVNATAGNLISDSTTTTATSLNIGIEPSNNWIKAISNGTNWIILRALF